MILPHREESKETASKSSEPSKKMAQGTCLDLAAGGGENSCDRRSFVRIQSFRRGDLAMWYGDFMEKEKGEVQNVADKYASTTVNVAKALGFSGECVLWSA